LDDLIAGKITWRVKDYKLKSGGTRKPPNIDAVKPNHRFLVYFSEGEKRVFFAFGVLAAKFHFTNSYKLVFYNGMGKVGFSKFPREVAYNEVKDMINWKPIEGNIQAIDKEDYLTLMHTAGIEFDLQSEETCQSEEPLIAESATEQPTDKSPPEDETPQKQTTYQIEREQRDTARVTWVKRSYDYHCQICLSKEAPEILGFPRSYAELKINRQKMIQGHHIREIKRDSGHDHVGNILSLCIYHHLYCLHPSPFKESLLEILSRSLGNVSEKEIFWPTGLVTNWKIMNTSETLKDGMPLKIVFNGAHLEELKKYIKYMNAQKLQG
jgi:hypothetical protein